MYEKVLVAVKLAHAAKSGGLMEKALEVARFHNAALHVITVVPEIDDNLKVLPEDSLPPLKAFVERFDATDVPVDVSIRKGTPHRAIPRAAQELGADLIVMNSHNPRIRDYLIGSTTAHVVMHVECDVLVVRQSS
jgi:nucleotide-binding universal stress UspA family protein